MILIVLLTVATAAVVVGGVLTIRADKHTSSINAERSPAIAVADRGVEALTTISPNNSAATLKRLEPSLTGDFLKQFESMTTTFTSVVAKGKVTSKGSIAASAVQSLSATQAKILVAATASVSAPKHQTTSRAYRIRVSLRRTGGAWRISGMEFVS